MIRWIRKGSRLINPHYFRRITLEGPDLDGQAFVVGHYDGEVEGLFSGPEKEARDFYEAMTLALEARSIPEILKR